MSLLAGAGAFLIQNALGIIIKRLFDLDWGKFEKLKNFVKEAESLPLPGKSDDDKADKDSWVRGKVLNDPELQNLKSHVIDWLIGAAVGLLKKRLIK